MNVIEEFDDYDCTNCNYSNLCVCSLQKMFTKIKKNILKLFKIKQSKVIPVEETLLVNDIESQIDENIIHVTNEDLERMYNNSQKELTEQLEKYIEESDLMDQIVSECDDSDDDWITVDLSE